MKPLIIVIAAFLLFIGPSFTTPSPFTALLKLEGRWAMSTKKGLLYEEWRKHSKDELRSKSYRLNGRDTVLLERVSLVNRVDGVFYIPIVEGQNNGQPVGFKLEESSTERFVFENAKHDYPQRIIYHFITSDSIVARVEGTKNGKSMGSDFYFKKQ